MTDQLDSPEMIAPDFVEPPTWPKAIGIISICWSALGLCCTGLGVAGIAMQASTGGMMSQMFDDGMPPSMTNPPLSTYIGMGVGLLNALILLVAGILLVMRNPVSRWIHLVYGVMSIGSLVWGTIAQMAQQAEIAQWCRDNPGTKFAESQAKSGTWGPAIAVVFMVFFSLWPLFCLVWFGLVKKDAAEYRRGIEQLT